MKSYKIGIIGLGYVGFPLACLFAKKYPTIGYDPQEKRIAQLREGIDITNEIDTEVIQARLNTYLQCTNDPNALKDCNVYIVAVPTPIDLYQQPDLTALRKASKTVGTLLKQGDIVIYESTVYPGVTEEVCVPILEQTAKLTFNSDFFVGYSPERVNPSDKQHTVENIKKITSGSTPAIAAEIDALYNSVLTGGTYPAEYRHPIGYQCRCQQMELPTLSPRISRRALHRRRPLLPYTKSQTTRLITAPDDGSPKNQR